MKIATFNINNVNRRLPNLLGWLKKAKPDVVCPQELKAEDQAFPEAALLKAGYGTVWRGQKTWNGVAILARRATPVLTRKALPGDRGDPQSRYIEAAAAGLIIGCLYLPNGNPRPDLSSRLVSAPAGPRPEALEKRRTSRTGRRLQRRAHRLRHLRHALMEKRCPGPAENLRRYRKLLDQGWTDPLRTLYPDKPLYTFWD